MGDLPAPLLGWGVEIGGEARGVNPVMFTEVLWGQPYVNRGRGEVWVGMFYGTDLCWDDSVIYFPNPLVLKEETEAENKFDSLGEPPALTDHHQHYCSQNSEPAAHTKGGSLGQPHGSFRKTHLHKEKFNEKPLPG